MAETSIRIRKSPDPAPARNYRWLREEGLKYIQLLSRKLWTDYNLHDPGITTLELLCYAISDLGYRIGQPLPDLLALSPLEQAAEEELPPAERRPAPFPTAKQVLPTRPVTVDDYRRLLIDIPDVRNAWLYPVTSSYAVNCKRSRLEFRAKAAPEQQGKIVVSGFYRVLLELEEDVTPSDAARRKAAITEAWKRLQANRNLCEEFISIDLVPQQPVQLCAEIEVEPAADVDLTEARVLRAVQQFLTPTVRFYSLAELLARGVPSDRIFEGPALENGFLDADELARAQIRREIRLSDILQVIMTVPGVRAVRDIIINLEGRENPKDPWLIQITAEGEPPLQPVINRQRSRLVFYKDLLPFQGQQARVETLLAEMEAAERAGNAPGYADLPLPEGRFRDPGHYLSIQQHYPRTYGISGSGLPESASVPRRAQARQLQGYLLFFDQVLAGYFAQLAHLREIFSLEEGIDKSYFSQLVAGVAAEQLLYANPDPAQMAAILQGLTETPAQFLTRRNQFLDHLLARFAENFNAYVWTMYAFDRSNAPAAAARAKRDFLAEYPVLSAHRGGAFDYTQKGELWDTGNVSGLVRRIGRLVGIRNIRRRNLANIRLDIYDERDSDGIAEYRFRIRDDRPEAKGKILLSSSWKHLDSRDARKEMHRVLGFALNRDNYQLRETKEEPPRFYFNLTDGAGDILARRIEYFATTELRDAAIDRVLDLLQDRYSDEGLFLVEHLLLRPEPPKPLPTPDAAEKLFLPVCVDGDCKNLKYLDPYSDRISFVLPAWPTRFADADVRRFIEKTIRQEVPAHLLARICWVDRKQMASFERAWQRWLRCKYGGAKGDEAALLAELVKALSNLRSVYDEAVLAPCDFILDRTVLGRRDG